MIQKAILWTDPCYLNDLGNLRPKPFWNTLIAIADGSRVNLWVPSTRAFFYSLHFFYSFLFYQCLRLSYFLSLCLNLFRMSHHSTASRQTARSTITAPAPTTARTHTSNWSHSSTLRTQLPQIVQPHSHRNSRWMISLPHSTRLLSKSA